VPVPPDTLVLSAETIHVWHDVLDRTPAEVASFFAVLSADEIAQIHAATLDILEQCGVKVLNKRMVVGCFPIPGIEFESAQCRIVAFPEAKC